MQQFSPWIAGFPGLIWSIDIPHSRLKVFNRWSIPGLDVPRLLKDARYRKKAVRREDHALLMEFWDMLTARRPAAVTFRLTNGNGTYILQGWPGENDSLYYGFLKEAFLPAAYSADGRPGTCQMDIGGIGYPVFALDIPTRGLLIINDAARSLFAAASRDPNTLGLADIAPGGLAEKLLEAGNKALANDAWAGTLTFSNAQRGLFSAKVRLTPCGGAGEGRVVRVALLNIPENRKSAACPPSEEDAQTAPRPLREGLESLFAPYAGELDGLLFSDIQSHKGQVVVYGAGPPSVSCAGARNTPTKAPSHRTSNASACARSPWRIRWTASSPSTGCCSPHTASAPISPNRSIRSRACTPSSSSPASAPVPSARMPKPASPASWGLLKG